MEYLVIGAGPAGLQLGYFLGRAHHDYLILEAGSAPGTFFRTFPRHRQLLSINKRHTGWSDPEINLRVDWNSLLSDNPDLLFTRYSDRYFPTADDLARYLEAFAGACNLRIQYNTCVTHVSRNGCFRVTDSKEDSTRRSASSWQPVFRRRIFPRFPASKQRSSMVRLPSILKASSTSVC